MTNPVAAFLALPLGTRVVVRHRIEGGATDVLGELIGRSEATCQVRTRAGEVTIVLANIIAAKQIPPPPAPRSRRSAAPDRGLR
ncbi:hypothetical protein SAMN04515671_0896 [Nakamurella panacisegetis]|uniref:Histone acetyltransferase Rv0428c-like SH3 domain-containing protein n=1 Tax=Nakamurella panacisegetis TaxID=1090615 RepID=A0A1H0JFR3_9ACTN|nr:hypothetical protein [Nakamurella panacisegetis]SDO42380.1 hypothetical protein SAMN04515671_0896 [Nakamurella panacisegetis]